MTSPGLDEALAALEEIRDDTLVRNQGMLARLATIRSALQHAALEAECWMAAKALTEPPKEPSR